MAATFPMTMQTDDIGAICAGIYNLGHHTSVQGVSGLLEQMLIKCANGHIVIIRVGTECLLMVVVKPDANFEQIFSQSKYLIEKIVMLMEKQG
jgi:predicted regulator of Ras-like GTPase activity (Roadblock/LC7/MglB family)